MLEAFNLVFDTTIDGFGELLNALAANAYIVILFIVCAIVGYVFLLPKEVDDKKKTTKGKKR